MGIRERLIKWVTRAKQPAIEDQPRPSTLNGLYGVSSTDYKKIAFKINEIEETIINLPPPTPPTDLKPLETRINEVDNKTVANRTIINQNSAAVNVLDGKVTRITNDLKNTNFADFKGVYNSNTTYKIGNLVSENNSHNIYISLVDNNLNHPLTDTNYWKVITFTIDTSNYLDKETNREQTIKAVNLNVNALSVNVGMFLSRNASISLPKEPVEDEDVVNKKYVDDRLNSGNKIVHSFTYIDYNTSLIKNDISNQTFLYNVETKNDYFITIEDMTGLVGKKFFCIIYIIAFKYTPGISGYANHYETVPFFTGYCTVSVNPVTNEEIITIPNPFKTSFVSKTDLKYGSSGKFNAPYVFSVLMIEE